MADALPTLVVSRRPRGRGAGWAGARSWFGGVPRLGGAPWPRGGRGNAPMAFVAQIDLGEVAREVASAGGAFPVPDGALAFFIGMADEDGACAVVHVPRGAPEAPTPLPADARAAYTLAGELFPAEFDDTAPRTFPRWPADVTALDVPPRASFGEGDDAEEAYGAAVAEAVGRRFRRYGFFLRASDVYKRLGEAARRRWWYDAHHYLATLRSARAGLPTRAAAKERSLEQARARLERCRPTGLAGLLAGWGMRAGAPGEAEQEGEAEVARLTADLERFRRETAAFDRFVEEVVDLVRGTDRWAYLPPEAAERLAALHARGREELEDFTRFHTPFSVDDLETETLLALATADDAVYATLPAEVRTLIDGEHLLPSQHWHQLFGRGVDVQGGAVWENEENVLLLQLVYDDVLHWRFGDMGAFQFWIPPEDLARADWSAVRLTFECH